MIFNHPFAQALAAALLSFFFATSLICAESDSPRTLESQLADAAVAETRADYAAARKIYSQATADYPASSEAWAALGEHLRFYAHDSDAAEAAFKKALAVEKPEPRAAAFAWRGLGELAAKAERDNAAIEFFKKSVDAFALADTYRSLCHLYCRQRQFTEAAQAAG